MLLKSTLMKYLNKPITSYYIPALRQLDLGKGSSSIKYVLCIPLFAIILQGLHGIGAALILRQRFGADMKYKLNQCEVCFTRQCGEGKKYVASLRTHGHQYDGVLGPPKYALKSST